MSDPIRERAKAWIEQGDAMVAELEAELERAEAEEIAEREAYRATLPFQRWKAALERRDELKVVLRKIEDYSRFPRL